MATDVGLAPCPCTSDVEWTLASDFDGFPPRRDVGTHKGTFGHVALVAGSIGFHGAAVLASRGAQLFYNLGTGSPTSNRAVIRAVEVATGKKVKVIESPRRPGDPPALYADSRKAQRELGWKVKFADIDSIVASAWKWHSTHPRGYADR